MKQQNNQSVKKNGSKAKRSSVSPVHVHGVVIHKSFAWGVIHRDNALCKNLIRSTAKEAMEAHLAMFPFHTRKTLKALGFKMRKLKISFRG